MILLRFVSNFSTKTETIIKIFGSYLTYCHLYSTSKRRNALGDIEVWKQNSNSKLVFLRGDRLALAQTNIASNFNCRVLAIKQPRGAVATTMEFSEIEITKLQ